MFNNVKKYIDLIGKEKHLPFIDVCAYKKHEEIFRYGKGNNYTGKEKFYLYSCTKPITVVLTMQLVERDALSLSDKVEDYLPSYKNVFLQNEKGEKVSPKSKITLFDLLTMSAGLTYNLNLYPIDKWQQVPSGSTITQKIVQTFAKAPLAFEPKEKFAYSLCHDVLGAVLEVATGKKLSDLMQEYLFAPLDMKNTKFAKNNDDVIDVFWDYGKEGIKNIRKNNNLIFHDEYHSCGAGLLSTVEDYTKFADMLACGGKAFNGKTILQEQTIDELSSIKLAEKSLSKGFSCAQGEGYGYGLGVRVRLNDTVWGLKKGEFGWDGASGCYLMVDKETQTSVFIAMNMRGWTTNFSGEHLNIVKEIYKNM